MIFLLYCQKVFYSRRYHDCWFIKQWRLQKTTNSYSIKSKIIRQIRLLRGGKVSVIPSIFHSFFFCFCVSKEQVLLMSQMQINLEKKIRGIPFIIFRSIKMHIASKPETALEQQLDFRYLLSLNHCSLPMQIVRKKSKLEA